MNLSASGSVWSVGREGGRWAGG